MDQESCISNGVDNVPPVERLPAELLGHIFGMCNDSNPVLNRFSYKHPPPRPSQTSILECMPWPLSHVSHRWREVSTSMAELWGVIDPPGGPRGLYPRDLLLLHLSRSENHLRSFDLECYSDPIIINALARDHHLWNHARLFINGPITPLVPQNAIMSALRSLHLSLQTIPEALHLTSDMVPRLHTFSLRICSGWVNVSSNGIIENLVPWSQLKRLLLENVPFAITLAVLGVCEELEELELRYIGYDLEAQVPSLVTLPRLRVLHGGLLLAPRLPTTLSFPVLKSLTLSEIDTEGLVRPMSPDNGGVDLAPDETRWFRSLSRSQCAATLIMLEFISIPITESHLNFLKEAHSLRVIRVIKPRGAGSSFGLEYHFLGSLVLEQGSKFYCPFLHTLEIASSDNNPDRVIFQLNALSRIGMSRRRVKYKMPDGRSDPLRLHIKYVHLRSNSIYRLDQFLPDIVKHAQSLLSAKNAQKLGDPGVFVEVEGLPLELPAQES